MLDVGRQCHVGPIGGSRCSLQPAGAPGYLGAGTPVPVHQVLKKMCLGLNLSSSASCPAALRAGQCTAHGVAAG